MRDSPIFSNYEIYQEYPVNRVNPDYPEPSHHFDWVIASLRVVIEGHGKQHYEAAAFDGDHIAAKYRLEDQQRRDLQKKEAAQSAGWAYVEIPYTAKTITDTYLMELILASQEAVSGYTKDKAKPKDDRKEKLKEIRQEYLKSDRHKEALERAKQTRKERYRRFKESNVK